MIGIRTPFRISFSGGSTDLPSFYRKNGGKVISTSINKYMYHFVHKFDKELIQVKYSETELVSDPKKIKHKIVNQVAKEYDISGLDINSIADIPKGSGLGSSSAYTVGLLNAVNLYNDNKLSKEMLAKKSAELEIEKLNEPIGKQDHYASTYGGVNLITFNKDDSVEVEKVTLEDQGVNFLNSALCLVKVGKTRSASSLLQNQNQSYLDGSNKKFGIEILNLVDSMYGAISNYDIKEIGKLLTENWQIKKRLSSEITNSEIEELNNSITNKSGIYGSKLLGAGGGGYLLICGEPKEINELDNDQKVSFKFENTGSTIIFQD
jgi:D-glycero-alpha-D-manno-heptose-7-phosphate kinase